MAEGKGAGRDLDALEELCAQNTGPARRPTAKDRVIAAVAGE